MVAGAWPWHPATDTVTHLVIQPGHRKEAARLVPAHLAETAGGEIRLRCTLAGIRPRRLLQEGHLWEHKEVAIPVTAVTRVDLGVRVNLTKEQVGNLPPAE